MLIPSITTNNVNDNILIMNGKRPMTRFTRGTQAYQLGMVRNTVRLVGVYPKPQCDPAKEMRKGMVF